MIKKFAFVLIAFLLVTSFVFATSPTITIISPNGASYLNGSANIVVSLVDTNANAQIDLNLGVGGSDSNVLTNFRLTDSGNCSNYTGDATSLFECTVSVNTTLFDDGNYTITGTAFDLFNSATNNSDSSDATVQFDNTAPVVTADQYDSDWNSMSQNIHFTCADALSTCEKINVNGTDYPGAEIWVLITDDGNNQVSFYGVDVVGNQGNAKVVGAPIDGEGPTISNHSPSNGNYVNDATPEVIFHITDGGSGVTPTTNDVNVIVIDGVIVPLGSFTITPTTDGNIYSYTLPSAKSSGDSILVQVDVNDSLENNTNETWNFIIDTEAPTSTSISASSPTNDETPEFDLGATDSGSGMGGGKMKFSCDNSNWASEVNYSSSYSSFNITSGSGCTNSEGDKTIYVQFRDAAGNWNTSSSSATISYDTSAPGTPSGLSASAGNEEVTLSWNSVSGASEYRIYQNGSQKATTSNTSYTITNLSNGTTYDFRISAVDGAGNEGSQSDEVSAIPSSDGGSTNADTTDPTISWDNPDSGDTVSGIIELRVRADDDDSGLSQVKFYVDNRIIDTVRSRSNGFYRIDWNSMTVGDGSHALKALALDRAENPNSASTSINITTENNGHSVDGPTGDEAEAQEAIKEAKDAKAELDEDLDILEKRGIEVSDDTDEAIDSAKSKLRNADDQFDDENYDGAKTLAENAKQGFETAKTMLSIETYSETDYTYNPNTLVIILQGLGMSQAIAEESAAFLENMTVERTLEILKVVDGSTTRYFASIKIVVENNGEAQNLKVLEIIPKGFIENASDIVGMQDFDIIEEDPTISFDLSIANSETIEIFYGLGEEMRKSDADNLLGQEVLNYFMAPPLLLNQDTAADGAALGGVGAGFFALPGLGDLAYLVTIVIVALIVLAIVVFLALNYLQNKDNDDDNVFGMGYSSEEKPFYEGLVGSIKDKMSKEPQEDQGPKWAYRN